VTAAAIEQFPVLNRWTGAVAFTATIEATPDMARGWKLRLAVAWALANSVPCTSLDLSGVDFTSYTCPPYSRFEDIRFEDSRFEDSRFEDSSFVRSSFVRSSFVDSSFVRSSFVDSRFEDSRFVDSSFVDSSFEGEPLTRDPICLSGLRWSVTITDYHMQIGCQFHRLSEWAAFDDGTIARMDARHAREFWAKFKQPLLTMAEAHGCNLLPAVQPEAA